MRSVTILLALGISVEVFAVEDENAHTLSAENKYSFEEYMQDCLKHFSDVIIPELSCRDAIPLPFPNSDDSQDRNQGQME